MRTEKKGVEHEEAQISFQITISSGKMGWVRVGSGLPIPTVDCAYSKSWVTGKALRRRVLGETLRRKVPGS